MFRDRCSLTPFTTLPHHQFTRKQINRFVCAASISHGSFPTLALWFSQAIKNRTMSFLGRVWFFLILLCLEGGTEAVQLPCPNGFLHLISPISSQLAAAQKEAPRNLRDPEADGRLGKREKPRSLCKIKAPT